MSFNNQTNLNRKISRNFQGGNISMKQNGNYFSELGKVPPQAIDVEEVVLGSIMLEKYALTKIVSLITPNCFYRQNNRTIYETVVELYDKAEPIDLITVTNRLRDKGLLDEVGGAYYVTKLTANIASSDNIEYHAGILLQNYIKRELISYSADIQTQAFSLNTDSLDLLGIAGNNLSKINEFTIRGGNTATLADATSNAMKEITITDTLAKKGELLGITTGLTELDKITNGWQNSELIIHGARPGMGKTAFMLKFARSAAEVGKKIVVFELEMTAPRLARRLLYSFCDFTHERVKEGKMESADWRALENAQNKLKHLPILIDDTPTLTMRYIRSKARVLKQQGKCDMVMIDYLQLIEPTDRNVIREQQVADISRQCKMLAKELNIPVHLLVQLNRAVELDKDKRPKLAHLRESGAIEQDADMVLLYFRPEYYGITQDMNGRDTQGIGQIIIAKYREGANVDVNVSYNIDLTKITDYNPHRSGYDYDNAPHVPF